MKFQRWVARHLHWVPIAVSMCILAPAACSAGAGVGLDGARREWDRRDLRSRNDSHEEEAAERIFSSAHPVEVFQGVEQPNEPPAADLEQLRPRPPLRDLGKMNGVVRSREGQATLRPGRMDPKPSPTLDARRIDGFETWLRESYKGSGQESEAVAIDNDVWFGSIREKGLNLILREAHTHGNGVINVRFADGVFDNIQ
jgi:hypothetical protein